MSHDELKIYLNAQSLEIRRYHQLKIVQGGREFTLDQAAFEWSRRFGDLFRERWFSKYHPETVNFQSAV